MVIQNFKNELNDKTRAHSQAFQIEMINQSRLERYWEIRKVGKFLLFFLIYKNFNLLTQKFLLYNPYHISQIMAPLTILMCHY
jgi:hypothetical protein